MTGRVDHGALRTNQAFIIGLLVMSFVMDWPWMVLIVALAMAIGAAWLRWGLFAAIYRSFLRDRFVRSELLEDNPEPHRFSQGFGAAVLAIAVVLFSTGSAAVAWAVVGLVVLLAGINLFAGFCAGCFLYYWLARLEVRGFTAKPIEGTVPGMRPG
jgi:hypothetical protein